MSPKAFELLSGLYEHPAADSLVEYRYSNDSAEKSMELKAFQELIDLGYIAKHGAALGFISISITNPGRAAVESA